MIYIVGKIISPSEGGQNKSDNKTKRKNLIPILVNSGSNFDSLSSVSTTCFGDIYLRRHCPMRFSTCKETSKP